MAHTPELPTVPDGTPAASLFPIDDRKALFRLQRARLFSLGYHAAAGMSEERFRTCLKPLKDVAYEVTERRQGHTPFLIVVPAWLVTVTQKLALLALRGGPGAAALEVEMLRNRQSVHVPRSPYLITQVNGGVETVTDEGCRAALSEIKTGARLGLTVDEGIALATHEPELLARASIACMGSRFKYDWTPELIFHRDTERVRLTCGLDSLLIADGFQPPGIATCEARVAPVYY